MKYLGAFLNKNTVRIFILVGISLLLFGCIAKPSIIVQQSESLNLRNIHEAKVFLKAEATPFGISSPYLNVLEKNVKRLNLFDNVTTFFILPHDKTAHFLILEFVYGERISIRENGRETSKIGNILILKVKDSQTGKIVFKAKETVVLSGDGELFPRTEAYVFIPDHFELLDAFARWAHENGK